MTAATNIKIDGDRLWRSLMEMAQLGATEKGGVCRLALSDADREGRQLFIRWCEEAKLAITVDKMGNIFARRPGKDTALPPVITGSHLDSQPTGGKFDGAYGVLAGLEVVRTLNDLGYETTAPLELVVWTNEEGARFAPAMTGSGVFAGVFDLEYAKGLQDVDGRRLGDELERIGFVGEADAGGHPVGAYFEAHIEQGPILEAEEKTIGVVTGAQGQRWYEVVLKGQEAHAGTTPMPRRRDALLGAARIIDEVNRIALNHGPDAVSTVGMVQVSPNSRNTIPGSVFFTIDLRHPEPEVLTTMDETMRQTCGLISRELGLELELDDMWNFPAAPFDEDCVAAVRDATQAAGFSHRDIVSGAGHDACYLARVAPTGMIFVPCVDGISHNEIEDAVPEDLAAGCEVLANAMIARANVA